MSNQTKITADIAGDFVPQSASLKKKPDIVGPEHTFAGRIQTIQRMLGNQSTRALFVSGRIQPALKIGEPDDMYEKEADSVANQVMAMPLSSESNSPPGVAPIQTKPG